VLKAANKQDYFAPDWNVILLSKLKLSVQIFVVFLCVNSIPNGIKRRLPSGERPTIIGYLFSKTYDAICLSQNAFKDELVEHNLEIRLASINMGI
jgi:hypothetical protein